MDGARGCAVRDHTETFGEWKKRLSTPSEPLGREGLWLPLCEVLGADPAVPIARIDMAEA